MSDRIRIAIDLTKKTTTEVILSGSPRAWNCTPLSIEFALFENGAVRSVVDFSSIEVVIKAGHRRGQPFEDIPVAAADLNTALTLAEWQAGVLYHGVAEFEAQDMVFDMQQKSSITLWLAFFGTRLSDGAPQMLGGCPLTVEESGINLDGNVATAGANLVSGGAVYDGSGNYVLALTSGVVHTYAQGANDDTLVNGAQTLTADGEFTAAGASVTLTGTIGQPVTAIVRVALTLSAAQVIALVSANAILVTNTAGKVITLRSPNGVYAYTQGVDDGGNFYNIPV